MHKTHKSPDDPSIAADKYYRISCRFWDIITDIQQELQIVWWCYSLVPSVRQICYLFSFFVNTGRCPFLKFTRVRGAPGSLEALWHYGMVDGISRSSGIWSRMLGIRHRCLRLLRPPCLDLWLATSVSILIENVPKVVFWRYEVGLKLGEEY